MNDHNRALDVEWTLAMAALEDTRGSIVPGGAQGGVVARERRAQAAEQAETGRRPETRRTSAAARARARVRSAFQAVEEDGPETA